MALKARLRALARHPWLLALILIAVVVSPGLFRIETILGAVRDNQEETQKVAISAETAAASAEEAATSAENAAAASQQLLDLVLDCVDPEGECAKESAAHDSAQAGAYNAAVIAAHFCTDQILAATYTLHELTVCVGDRLDGRD